MGIHHLAITINDLEVSKLFYKKYFGFTELISFERKDLNAKAILMECDNLKLEMWQFEEPLSDHSNFPLNTIGIRHIAFLITDLEGFIEKHRYDLSIGEIQVGSSGGKYVFIKDPSGVDIELYQPPKELV